MDFITKNRGIEALDSCRSRQKTVCFLCFGDDLTGKKLGNDVSNMAQGLVMTVCSGLESTHSVQGINLHCRGSNSLFLGYGENQKMLVLSISLFYTKT